MAQLRAKQIRLTGKNDLLIGGDTNGNGSVLPVGSEKQVLKIVGGNLAYALQAAADVVFGDATYTATNVSTALVEAKGLATAANGVATALATSTGMNADGTFKAPTGTNYINSATSLANADVLIDTKLKAVQDQLNALGTGSVTAVQNEVDTVEASVGLNSDGTLAAFQTGGAVAGKTTFLAAVNALDSAITANTTAIGNETTRATAAEGANTTAIGNEVTRATGVEGNIQAELDKVEVTVGANADGTAKPYANGNYIVMGDGGSNAPDDHTVAIGKLDAALKTTSTAVATETTRATGAENAIIGGAGLSNTGAYAPDSATTYIKNATSLANADKLLDTQIKANSDAIAALSGGGNGSLSSVQTELDTFEATVGTKADGTLAAWAAPTGTHLGSATTYKAAIEALDAGLAADDTAISNLNTQVAALAGLHALHFAGTVDGNETNTSGVTPTPAAGNIYRVTTDGSSNWAGTGIEVNAGDYVVCTDPAANSGQGAWVKFDNTDPTISTTDTNLAVTGNTHAGFQIALANKAALTSTSTAIVVTGGAGSLLSAASVALDPSKINFSALAQTGNPAAAQDQKYLKWDNTAGALTYVSAGQIGVTIAVDEDFVPGANGVAANPGANASVTITATPVGQVSVYINGVKLKISGFTQTGTTITLNDANNGYAFESGDVLTVAYDKYVA